MNKWKLLSALCILASVLLLSGMSNSQSTQLAYEDGAGPLVMHL